MEVYCLMLGREEGKRELENKKKRVQCEKGRREWKMVKDRCDYGKDQ